MKTPKLCHWYFFIVKLGLISDLFMVCLLLTLSMLLLNKICPIAHILRRLHIPVETGGELNVHKFYNRSFRVLSPGKLLYENRKNSFLGKSQNYYTTVPRQEKRQQAKSLWQKNLFSSKYALLTKTLYLLALLLIIVISILVACSKQRLFLYWSFPKTLRSTNPSSYPYVLTTFVYHWLCLQD